MTSNSLLMPLINDQRSSRNSSGCMEHQVHAEIVWNTQRSRLMSRSSVWCRRCIIPDIEGVAVLVILQPRAGIKVDLIVNVWFKILLILVGKCFLEVWG